MQGDAAERSETTPIPVPPGMRTSRNLPRIIALILVCTSAIIFYTGTAALARRESGDTQLRDQLLPLGVSHWILSSTAPQSSSTSPVPGSCIAVATIKLQRKKHLSLTVDSLSSFVLLGKAVAVQLNATGDFSDLHTLDRFRGVAAIGSNKVMLASVDNDPARFDVTIQSPTLTKTVPIPRPEPILLIERTTNHYLLRLPAFTSANASDKTTATESLLRSSFSLAVLPGVTTKVVSNADADTCRKQLHSAQLQLASDGTPSNIQSGIDLGSLFMLLGVKPDEGVVTALTEGTHDRVD